MSREWCGYCRSLCSQHAVPASDCFPYSVACVEIGCSRSLLVLLPRAGATSLAKIDAFGAGRADEIDVAANLVGVTEHTNVYCAFPRHVRYIRYGK
jgi:hypothetical protein